MNSSNSTAELDFKLVALSSSTKDPMISLAVPAVMFASGVFGNVLALVVLVRSSKETKKSVFYRLVGALACTDLLGTCATSPVTLAVYSNNLKWLGGKPLCDFESFMLIFAGCSTVSIICAMSVDRFLSICHPFAYAKYANSKRTKIGLFFVWCFATVMGLMPIVGLGENVVQFPGTWCFFTFTSSEIKNLIYTYVYAAIGLLAILVTVISNCFVTWMLLKMQRRSRRKRSVCFTCTRRQSKETQMLILMVGIIAIFTTCWGPFLIRIIINQVNRSQQNVRADLLVLRLASLNQILDPWIYILFRRALVRKVKKTVTGIISKCFPAYEEYIQGRQLTVNGIGNARFDFNSDNEGVSSEKEETYGSSNSDGESPRRVRRPSRKMLKMSRSTMMASQLKMMNEHTQSCPGLKHTHCFYCFALVPQNFVLTFGSSVIDSNKLDLPTFDNNVNQNNMTEEEHVENKLNERAITELKDEDE